MLRLNSSKSDLPIRQNVKLLCWHSNADLQSNFNAQSARNRLCLLASSHLKAKVAFTLAEVLITLGIIGVVAAMTMPTLIAKFQKQVYVNKLKKMISILENGIRKAAVDEGIEVKESKFYQLFNVYSCICAHNCEERVEAIKKIF